MFIQNRMALVESVETLLAQEQRMNQIANNLANVDTSGYKKENVTFWEMLFTAHDDRQRVGKAMRVISDHSQGPMEMTGNPLDIAIEGEGFFRIQTPEGIRYTRSGSFNLNSEGQMVTPDGNLLIGEGGPVVVNGKEISVNQGGGITVDGELVNQLAIVTFDNYENIEKEGNSLFKLTDETVAERISEDFRLQQGFLEGANVNSTLELTEMIDLHRAYQAQQKIIQTVDELDSQAINRVGKLTG